jgi:hypothetical protein
MDWHNYWNLHNAGRFLIKTYSVSIKSAEHSDRKLFQESEYFKEKAKERYKIEAKNS